MKEVWRDVVGFGGIYSGWYKVSNLGRVRRLPRWVEYHDQKPRFHPGGILGGKERVHMSGRDGSGKNVQRSLLVAYAFIPNPKNKPVVNHIDRDRSNNRTDNLEWATYQENTLHWLGVKNYLDDPNEEGQPFRIRKSKIDKITADKIRKKYRTGKYSLRVLGKKFGVSRTTISLIVKGRIWK